MRLLFTLFIILMLSGCTGFRIKTEHYRASYTTLFEDKEFDEMSIKRNEDGSASVKLKKYSKEVNKEAIAEASEGIGTIAGKAAQAAVTL